MRRALIASLLVSCTGPFWLVASLRGFLRWERGRSDGAGEPPGLARPLVHLGLGVVLTVLLALGYLASAC